jgi:hypothetical protein
MKTCELDEGEFDVKGIFGEKDKLTRSGNHGKAPNF